MQLNTQILESIENGELDTFTRLVGHDESLRHSPNAFGSWLHCACRDGQLQIVKYLVEGGGDVNLRAGMAGIGDAAPLEDAASAGFVEIVEYLASKGAKLDVSTPGRNPLFSAIYEGHTDVAEFLLDADIEPHVVYRRENGKLTNALSFAQEIGRADIGNLLIKAGCRLPIEGVDKPVWEPGKIYEPTVEDKAHQQIIARLAQVFGRVDPLALREAFPVHDEVSVTINVIRPNDHHPFLTLFTTGMSDRPMTVPKGQEAFQYAELVMHLPALWPHPEDKEASRDTFWPFQWLRQVAYYPHLNDTWLGGPLSIISSDEPPVPLGPNIKQTCLLLEASVSEWSPMVVSAGKSVPFHTVIPIYTEEREFEKKHGIAQLVQRLHERGYTAIVSLNRANVGGE